MTNAARGVKRRCTNCDAPFYDMGRSPIRCPRCGAELDAAAATRLLSVPATRKARNPRGRPAGGSAAPGGEAADTDQISRKDTEAEDDVAPVDDEAEEDAEIAEDGDDGK